MRRQIRLVAGSNCPKWSGTDKTEVSLTSVEQRNTSNTSGQLHIRRGLLERRFHANGIPTLVIDMRGRTITVPKIRCLCTPLYSQSRTWVECFSPHSASLIIALGSASFISSARARVSAARIHQVGAAAYHDPFGISDPRQRATKCGLSRNRSPRCLTFTTASSATAIGYNLEPSRNTELQMVKSPSRDLPDPSGRDLPDPSHS